MSNDLQQIKDDVSSLKKLQAEVAKVYETEVCTEVIHQMFVNNLKLDGDQVTQIKLARCHRVGKYQKDSPRTIICRFHYFEDREQVWNNRSKLQGSVIRMSEDCPKEIVSKRNALSPFMFEARRQKLKINRDRPALC